MGLTQRRRGHGERIRPVLGFLRAAAILVGVFLAGDAVSRLLHLPIPGSVIGMVTLAGALRFGLVREAWVEPAAEFLLRHMALLYVPAGVGIMAYAGLIRREWPALLAAGVGGMLAVLLVVGLLQQRLERGG